MARVGLWAGLTNRLGTIDIAPITSLRLVKPIAMNRYCRSVCNQYEAVYYEYWGCLFHGNYLEVEFKTPGIAFKLYNEGKRLSIYDNVDKTMKTAGFKLRLKRSGFSLKWKRDRYTQYLGCDNGRRLMIRKWVQRSRIATSYVAIDNRDIYYVFLDVIKIANEM